MKEDFFIVVGILDKSVIIFKGCDEPQTLSLYISDDHSHSRSKTRIGSLHFTDGKLHLWINKLRTSNRNYSQQTFEMNFWKFLNNWNIILFYKKSIFISVQIPK